MSVSDSISATVSVVAPDVSEPVAGSIQFDLTGFTNGTFEDGPSAVWVVAPAGITIADDALFPVDQVNCLHGAQVDPQFYVGSNYADNLQAYDGRLRSIISITGVTGTFTAGETVTGGTSGATSRIKTVKETSLTLETIIGGPLVVSETLTGGTSGATATVSVIQTDYDRSLLASYPVTLSPGQILVKSKSRVAATFEDRNGLLDEAAALYVLSSAPAANSWAPATIGWPGRTTPTPTIIDLDAVVTAFKATLPVGGYDVSAFASTPPTFAAIQASIGRFMPLYPQVPGAVFYRGGYETIGIPYRSSASSTNYGEFLSDDISTAYLYACSNLATDTQIKEILRWLISMGLQWLPPFKGVAENWGGNGGHYQFQFLPMVLAEWAQGNNYTDISTYHPANQLAQTIKWTTATIASALVKHTLPSDDVDASYIYRVRDITSVTTNTISFPYSSALGDAAQVNFNNLNLYRASDDSLIGTTTGGTGGGGVYTITLAGHGLSDTDQIYFAPSYTILDGDYDWLVRQAQGTTGLNTYNPNPLANYRFQQYYAASAIAAILQGGSNALFENLIGYVSETIDPTSNLFISVSGGTSSTYPAKTAFQIEFVDTYWASIHV